MKIPLVKALALGTLLILASGQTSAQNPTIKTAMRIKLLNTERLLEAVVTSDFATIARSAEALNRISDTEIISWRSAAQPEYQKQATLFVLSVRGLQEAAGQRNLDAAIFEFNTLVSSCTRCHAHVRRSNTVSFERLPSR